MRKLFLGGCGLLLCVMALGQHSTKGFNRSIKKYRKEYKQEFIEKTDGPLSKEDLHYLSFFQPDQSYQVSCQFKRAEQEEPFDMATYAGTTQPYIKYGTLTFQLKGKDYVLAVYQNLRLLRMPHYKDYLFIPFKDLTNGESTYGGGRYLDISRKDIINDQLTLDFNLAYNPYCAYKDGYQCPIPPEENHLEVEILAGERGYRIANHD